MIVLSRRMFLIKKIMMLTFLFGCMEAHSACQYSYWDSYVATKLYRRADGGAYFYVTDRHGIDADGAPNAYHPDDIGLSCIESNNFKGLDCLQNAGYPDTDWWRDVLVEDSNGKTAKIRDKGDFSGYFISKTTLSDPSKEVLEYGKYVDSTKIPYVVFPGRFNLKDGTGKIGDYGLAISLSKNLSSPFIVADIGPYNNPLGEVSIALSENLGGVNPNPRTGSGKPKGDFLYVVFPYSSDRYDWPKTVDEINMLVNRHLEEVGGIKSILNCLHVH